MWARIIDNKIMELTDVDPAGRFVSSLRWVDVGTAAVKEGWVRNDVGEFTAPPQTSEGPKPNMISAADFLGRFTPAEMDALQAAALQAPSTVASRRLFNFLLNTSAQPNIDLSSQRVQTALALVVSANLLTALRAQVILTP